MLLMNPQRKQRGFIFINLKFMNKSKVIKNLHNTVCPTHLTKILEN